MPVFVTHRFTGQPSVNKSGYRAFSGFIELYENQIIVYKHRPIFPFPDFSFIRLCLVLHRVWLKVYKPPFKGKLTSLWCDVIPSAANTSPTRQSLWTSRTRKHDA